MIRLQHTLSLRALGNLGKLGSWVECECILLGSKAVDATQKSSWKQPLRPGAWVQALPLWKVQRAAWASHASLSPLALDSGRLGAPVMQPAYTKLPVNVLRWLSSGEDSVCSRDQRRCLLHPVSFRSPRVKTSHFARACLHSIMCVTGTPHHWSCTPA